MFNLEQHLISFIQKAVALIIRLRWGFVITSFLYASYIYFGFLALLFSIAICTILFFIGYSEAEKEDDKWNKIIDKTNELIRTILRKEIFITNDLPTEIKRENRCISLVFFSLNKKNNQKIKFFSLFFTIILMIAQYVFCVSNYKIFFLVLIFLISLVLREQLLEYRIRKGLFGTNRTEARELIDFIIKNSDNLDFTDSNGNLRRALLPEAKDAAEEHIPSTLGEEARA